MAYAEQLAAEANAHFKAYAQEHICVLKQRRYVNGELTEMNMVHFASADMTREEVIALLKEALQSIEEGGGYSFEDSEIEAEPTAMMMAPSLEAAEDTLAEEEEAEEDEGENWKN